MDIRIFPNPSDGVFSILNIKDHDLLIYNLTGNIVYWKNSIQENLLNISDLEPGMYIISIQREEQREIRKIIIK